MRITLTDDDARRIRSAIECYCIETVAPDEYRDRLLALFTPPPRLTVVLGADDSDPANLVPTCPKCGGQTFCYLEGTWQHWAPGPVGDGLVTLYSYGWEAIGDGDSDPGLICDPYEGGGCGSPIDLPEGWEIAWD